MLGSDNPFPLGEDRVGSLIRGMEGLGVAARRNLLVDNARRLLRLA